MHVDSTGVRGERSMTIFNSSMVGKLVDWFCDETFPIIIGACTVCLEGGVDLGPSWPQRCYTAGPMPHIPSQVSDDTTTLAAVFGSQRRHFPGLSWRFQTSTVLRTFGRYHPARS